MHPRLVEELLAEEVAAVQANARLRERLTRIEQRDRSVLVWADGPAGLLLLRLDGPNYDAEPLSLMALDPEGEAPLPGSQWPPGLYFGSDHPLLERPWACIGGTYEYHLHPSHLNESWDRFRYGHDLATLIGHLLNKARVL